LNIEKKNGLKKDKENCPSLQFKSTGISRSVTIIVFDFILTFQRVMKADFYRNEAATS